MPSGAACESDGANLYSSGTARPIGVNAPMTSPQAAAAASQAAHLELPSTAQRVALPLIGIRALVGAPKSQNTLET
jgi:hypothetical protein